jgi:hypothetical protein
VDVQAWHQNVKIPTLHAARRIGHTRKSQQAHEAGPGSNQDYGFLSGVSLMMRGAAGLTTKRSGLFFFGFFFSRLGASLFPMGAACHGLPHLARDNELPAALSQGSHSLGSVMSGKMTYPVPSRGVR